VQGRRHLTGIRPGRPEIGKQDDHGGYYGVRLSHPARFLKQGEIRRNFADRDNASCPAWFLGLVQKAVGAGYESCQGFPAAIARREIASLGAVIERASNQSEHLIVGLMSMGVVEILKEIDIGDDQAKTCLFYPRFHC